MIARVSLEIALGLMTLTSMLAAAIQAVQVQPEAVDVQEVRRQARAFWQPGRLILASSLMNLLTINGFFWILALRSGAESAASFQAAMNLLGVSHPLLFSVGNVILPSAARANHTAGWKGACRCAWKHSAQLGVLLFVFFGQQSAVMVAAGCNIAVGVLVSAYARRLAAIGRRSDET